MTQKFFEKKPILIEKKEYLFKSQLFHKFTNIKKFNIPIKKESNNRKIIGLFFCYYSVIIIYYTKKT